MTKPSLSSTSTSSYLFKAQEISHNFTHFTQISPLAKLTPKLEEIFVNEFHEIHINKKTFSYPNIPTIDQLFKRYLQSKASLYPIISKNKSANKSFLFINQSNYSFSYSIDSQYFYLQSILEGITDLIDNEFRKFLYNNEEEEIIHSILQTTKMKFHCYFGLNFLLRFLIALPYLFKHLNEDNENFEFFNCVLNDFVHFLDLYLNSVK